MKWNLSRRAAECCGLFLIAGLLSGCFSDPNPDKRYTFPGSHSDDRTTVASTAPVAGGTGVPRPGSAAPSTLRVGDLLTITFSDMPPPGLQEIKTRIPDDGTLTLHHNVRLKAAGKTVTQLQEDIRKAYVPDLFVNLTAVVKTEERFLFVDGEVKLPQRVIYVGEMTVLRAIGSAGGFTDFANRKKIEVRRENGEKLTVNYNKAIRESKYDPPVFPNDYIVVPRRWF